MLVTVCRSFGEDLGDIGLGEVLTGELGEHAQGGGAEGVACAGEACEPFEGGGQLLGGCCEFAVIFGADVGDDGLDGGPVDRGSAR